MDYKYVNKKDTSAKILIKNPKISLGFGGTWGGKQEFSLKQPSFLKLVSTPKKSDTHCTVGKKSGSAHSALTVSNLILRTSKMKTV